MGSEELFAAFAASLGLPLDPETPARVVSSLKEMTRGYFASPEQILAKTFPCEGSPSVRFSGIEFVSLCEHHWLPVAGEAEVEYQPVGRVVGLSKMARLVDCFARRLTLQERMTNEIADAVHRLLAPAWVTVSVRARHGCLECRGVRQRRMRVTTVARRGDGPDNGDRYRSRGL